MAVQRCLKKKVKLSPDFPSAAVVDAYLHPQIDESQECFDWGLPDLDGLRRYPSDPLLCSSASTYLTFFRFAKAKMGWPEEKVDELVLPILKLQAASAETTQTTITEFSSTNRRLTPKLKR